MNEWDRYWSKKKQLTYSLYDKIAIFYRKHIVPGILNFFLDKNYKKGCVLLHAGCGNGDVDERVSEKFKVLSLDNSMTALRANNSSEMLVQGDVFQLPMKDSSIDGIYNLGLMQHFTENDIIKILKESARVLKPAAKMTVLWPPEFGLSVIFLKIARFILNGILRKNIKLQPDEMSRIRSYSHAKFLCERANFKIMGYYFGPKDFFTHVVLTLQKNL